LTLFLFTIIVAINESILLISSLYLLVSNLFFCAIFFLDKKRAKLDGQRVSEFSLCVLAMLSFNLTTLLMQALIRHKTIKWQFNGKICITFVMQNTLLLLYFAIEAL
tara:strand:+ start:150 stop:470 length:321 start_codon:yes stop_codon:yes gene_type:complete